MNDNQPLELGSLRGCIVVAVDGSEHADRALRWAAEQARLEGRRLAVVAVGHDAEDLRDTALVTAREGLAPDEVVGWAQTGDPRQVLIDVSEHAHLLVLGSRGRGTVRSMVLGSVSAAVSRHAACPVVVCRPPGDVAAKSGILVGVDATPESRPVIEFAYRQASLRQLPLTVLHTFWDAAAAVAQYREDQGTPQAAPELEELRATLAEVVAGFAEQYPDVAVSLTLKHGLADEALSPRDGAWELVVVGRHPMNALSRLLTGSVATAVLERSRSTVAVVPVSPPRD